MRFPVPSVVGLVVATWLTTLPVSAQQVTKEEVAGVTNFARLETTVACAGATRPEAMPELKKMGFVSVINLRRATEQGANVEAEAAAAREAGLRYFHIPFDGGNPDPAVADQFVEAITMDGSEPAFIHCAGGNRAAAMWLIKRLAVDHWDVDRASEEATALGLTSGALKEFAVNYAQSHHQ